MKKTAISAKSKPLIIVESPAKARTISHLLSDRYRVEPCFGHVRDLPKSKMGIDLEHGFELQYVVSPDKLKIVNNLKKLSKTASTIILASDEDREGEAIAWHISTLVGVDGGQANRIVFHEITQDAIEEALKNPRQIDMQLVNAQQARRALDRLVGYELSPLLWKKVQRGLSAGRVQSVAVRLIVEKEAEINAFQDSRQWRLSVKLTPAGKQAPAFSALLEQPKLKNEQQATDVLALLQKSPKLEIRTIDQTSSTRSPAAPFTTSSLQQTAAYRLKMTVRQTMVLAQRLYEAGLITYMRTDSVNLADSARQSISQYLTAAFGSRYIGHNSYRSTSKSAQEAHEAIRPTDIRLTSAGEDNRQRRLYELIHERTLASQMAPALLERTTVGLIVPAQPDHKFVAKGLIIKFDGFLRVTRSPKDQDQHLPQLKTGELIDIISARAEEKSKTPPARYSEATLVKKLEELGIGRPSTYAPTISTIQDRGYVEKTSVPGELQKYRILELKNGQITVSDEEQPYGFEKGKLVPTDVGRVVTTFLVKHFQDILSYDFTAQMENQLDEVAIGRIDWQKLLKDFYSNFKDNLETVDKSVSRQDVGGMRMVGTDSQTGLNIYARLGRFGPVLQQGESSATDKPHFAPLPKGTSIETVTLEQALQMLSLPRVLGPVGPEKSSEFIEVSIGKFGPYVKRDGTYASIEEGQVFSIDYAAAEKILDESKQKHQKTEIKKFPSSKLRIMSGRYGPYVTDGTKNASIPKSQDPATISEEEALAILSRKKPGRHTRHRRRP